MPNDRHRPALFLHALGWMVFFATAVIARSTTTGWLPSIGVAVGTVLFVGLLLLSGAIIVDSLRAADRVSARSVCHARRASVTTWPTYHRYSTTTIRRRCDAARR